MDGFIGNDTIIFLENHFIMKASLLHSGMISRPRSSICSSNGRISG
jgi:hypothetical protein